MAYLRDNGARAKLQNVFDVLRTQLPDILTEVGGKVAMQVAARAPSPETEEQTMMYGGSVGLDQGGEDNRVRFIKNTGNFLKEFIPTSYRVEDLYLGVGVISDLDRISSYQYINATKSGQFEHTVTAPFWWAWEVGGVFTIVPKFTPKTGGRGYPLKPTPNDKLWRMTKVIPPRYMYSSVNYDQVIETLLIPRIRKLISRMK